MPEIVTVACKMPNGVVLDLDRYERRSPDSLDVHLVRGKLAPVTLKGWAHPLDGQTPAPPLHGGYRLNQVDAAFWDAWVKQNPDSPLLKDNLLVAHPKSGDAIDAARERASVPAQFAPASGNEVAGVTQAERIDA